jgi:three-Cys-motif partner protein
MAAPRETIWDIEPHTLAKHEILRRYLGAWFPILGTHNRRIVYIDGFCGPGRYAGGESGSPIIALQEAINQAARLCDTEIVFLFVDERADRIAHLKKELAELSLPTNYRVQATTGMFENELEQLLDRLDAQGLQLAPTFAFLDPFGFKGLPFRLVRRLLTNDKTEIFINIMADAINRFLEHPDDQVRQHIIELFGTDEVLSVAQSSGDRVTGLRLLYQQQLQSYARYVRYFEMRDCDGKTIYYLFFASNHPLGHVRMKEAFWKIDPSSGFCFSDATDPNQLVLFENDETPRLADDLARAFAKRKVSVEQVKKYVENTTPFVATHMREALKLLEGEGRIKANEYKLDGSKRRKNTYPDNAQLEFC